MNMRFKMKKLKTMIVVMLFVVLFGSTFAIDLAQWQYQANVEFGENIAEYCKLEITPPLYDTAKRDLADIRLIGADGLQKPYLIITPRDVSKRYRYSLKMINKSTDADGNSLVTLDFGKQIMKNSVKVSTDGSNFRRAVKVEGSNDNITFFTVVEEAYVFAVGDRMKSKFERIDLPANDYRYLRITVKPMILETESPVIYDVMASRYVSKPAPRQIVPVTPLGRGEDEKNNQSNYEYDLGFSNLPVSEVALNITDKSFYRSVSIWGRDVATRKVKIPSEDNRERFKEVEVPWTRMNFATIYRYLTPGGVNRENVRLPISGSAYRYLKVTVNNYDDRPLDVQSATAKMIAQQLLFPSEKGSAAVLYAGAPWVSGPQYDIRQRIKKPSKVKASAATIGSFIENPLFGKADQKQIAWTEKHKNLLLVLLGVIVAVTGVFMLKSFKSIQTEQTEQNE
jgi:hypothetical protein